MRRPRIYVLVVGRDVVVRLVEESFDPMELVLLERLPDLHADELVPSLSLAPAGEADGSYDGVDVPDHFADDDGDAFRFVLLEDLREGAYVWVQQVQSGFTGF